jgi:hypothetical protein
MTIQVIEVQNKKTTRTYNLKGPKLETVQSFWDYLKSHGVIESYELKEV